MGKADATYVKPTVAENVVLAPPLSEREGSQIETDAADTSNGKFLNSWKGHDVISHSLGMTSEQAIAIWDKQGRPIVHLGPGENCDDLAKFLEQRDIKPEHLSAIREWLEKHGGG